jgi:Tfp pilus assembly protein PilN
MKKFLIFMFVFGLLLSSGMMYTESKASSMGIGEGSGDGKRETWRENKIREISSFKDGLRKDRESFLRELKARKDSWKNLSSERKNEFCGKAKEMINRRFMGAISEIEKFQTRINEVITKLKAEGKDTTLAEESLKMSEQKLAEAKTKMEEIKKLVPESCRDMTPEVFEKIKIAARTARDLLKESKEHLRQAIKDIKDLRPNKENKEADKNDENGKNEEDDDEQGE